jgi:prepilin-type N-terminal cleavage/methylation domain-containing protein
MKQTETGLEWSMRIREKIKKPRRGFTLIELLVAITIILVVSAVALPTVLPALSHRQVSEGTRILTSQLAGARDAAIRDNAISGIRLIADPTTPNSCNRFLPITQPPAYGNGIVSCYPGQNYTAVTGTALPLVLEEVPGQWVLPPPPATKYVFVPNEPTNWYYNVRLGDRLQINGAGAFYSVCGPISVANSESFVNIGASGVTSTLTRTFVSPDGQSITQPVEYLFLTNGQDDNGNGWADEGFDGVDNDGDNLTDETTCTKFPTHGEWEQEQWLGSLANNGTLNATYSIVRRPLPAFGAREVVLPTDVVVDMSRSTLPSSSTAVTVNGVTTVQTVATDLLVKPDGSMTLSLPFSVPSSIPMNGSFYQLWIAEREDVGHWQVDANGLLVQPLAWAQSTPTGQWRLITANGKTGAVTSLDQPDVKLGYQQAMLGIQD